MSRADERRGDKTRFDLLMLAVMTEGQHAPPTRWEQIQSDVRAGLVGKYLEAGDVLSVNVGGNAYDFDVLGLDEDEPVDTSFNHVLSIQMHKVLSQINFDPPQYLFPVTAESLAAIGISGSVLPAGTYHVTLDRGAYNGGTAEDGKYQFTTTQDVPIGGGIRHSYMGTYQSSSYAKANVLAGTFITYTADTVTTIETGLATTEGDGGTSLGTATAVNPSYKVGDYINYTQRQRYGSNRWSKSWIRQLLNSNEATFRWAPGTVFSRNIVLSPAPAGFLYSLDADLRAVLGKVRKRYALSVSDGGGYEDVEDMVTLATLLDMGGGNNNSIVEGPVDANGTVTRSTAYSLWKNATNADRIKYRGSSAVVWWLGSSFPSIAYSVRYVNSSGAFSFNYAYSSLGVVPSLHII